MGKTRVVIAADHSLFRSGLHKLLEAKSHLSVVGEAASGDAAVSLVHELHPDVLVFDEHRPNLSGIDVLRQMGPESHTRMIMLITYTACEHITKALQSGAKGVVLKNSAMQSVFNSIDTVMNGHYWVYHTGVSDLTKALSVVSGYDSAAVPPTSQFDLTQREFDVIKAIVSGHTNRVIAKRLSISEHTVKRHVTNIFNKTGTSNRLELTLFAIERRLVDAHAASNGA